MHIKAITLDKYRGITNLKLDDLSRVNAIVGVNNCGKTSVLEALSIMSDPQDMSRLLRIAFQRSQSDSRARYEHIADYAASVFRQGEMSLSVTAAGTHSSFQATGTLGSSMDSNGVESKTFTVTTCSRIGDANPVEDTHVFRDGELTRYRAVNPLYKSLYLCATTNYYRSCANALLLCLSNGGKSEVLHTLQLFDSSITDISLAGSEIYLESQAHGTLPLYNYGAGMQKAACLAAILVNCAGSVVLIDEIETAIHSSAFQELLRWFLEVCVRLDIQAFVTTHSAEALDALIEAAHGDTLRVITLRKGVKTGNTIPLVRSGEEAYRAREDCGLELRT